MHYRWVQTRMGDFAAKAWNFPGDPPHTIDQSVKGILDIVSDSRSRRASHMF